MAARRTKPAPKKAAKKKASKRAPKRPTKPRLQAALEEPARTEGPGRPPEYLPSCCELAAQAYAAGATDMEVADLLQISAATLYSWQQRYPEFLESTKAAKEPADDRVERSLYNRAVGYTFESEKILVVEGEVVRVPTREHVAPDPKAALTWLKNRRPAQWRDVKHLEGKVQLAELLTAAAAEEGGE